MDIISLNSASIQIILLYDPILSPINPGGSSASHIWNNFIIGINLNLKTAICLGHQNLNFEILPNDATKIRYQFFGAPGSRKLVVDYCEMRQLGTTNPSAPIICSTNLVTNQVILYEGSNIIEFYTKNMPASAVCPYYSAGPNNAVQGLYYYDQNNVAQQVYSPGRAPGDNWGAVGGQYTSRRFTPIANPPYYKVDTIPYNLWQIIGHVEFTSNTPPYTYVLHTIDTAQFFWYDALGNQVSQGATLNATATAASGQNSTYFVVKYLGPAGCDTVSNLTDTFWVHFAENDTLINVAICEGESYNFLGNNISAAGVYDTLLTNHLGCDSLVRLNLVVHPLPQAVIKGNNPALTCAEKLYFFEVDSTLGYSYQWYQNGVAITGADSNAYGTATAANYSVW